MLRDRLVCGIGEEQILCRFFSVTGLTFDKALKITQAMEAANKDMRELQTQLSESSSASNQDVHKMAAAQSETRREHRRACYRCGSEQHMSNDCRFISAKCYMCGKSGHIQKNV